MKKQPVIFYGWFIVAAALAIKAATYLGRYSFSVIFVSLIQEFHWPRDITAAMLSIHILSYGLVSPLAGALVDRIGPRKTMGLGATMLALGLAISQWGTEPWHFYLTFGVLCGASLSLVGTVAFTIVIKNWFERNRGLALSLVFSGVGLSHAFYPLVALLISTFGWQNTFVIEGVIIAAVTLPLITFVVRYHPRDKGLMPYGAVEPKSSSAIDIDAPQATNQAATGTDWTLLKAVKTGRFWLLCLATFSIPGVMQHILIAHHIAFAVDIGYSKIFAASVLSLYGFLYFFGCMTGFASDRFGRELMITLGTIIGISSIFALMLISDTSQPWMLYYYAAALGLSQGITVPVLMAAITDVFQGPKVGAIIGFIWFGFAVGGAIGPWLGGWIFELTGNYQPAFMVSMVHFALGCAALWLAAPRKARLVSVD